MHRTLTVHTATYAIRGVFRISRGARTHARQINVEIAGAGARGRGACVPYARYGETLDSVAAQIETARALIESGAGREALAMALPAGAARNALDCALWDLEAKQSETPVWRLAGLAEPAPVVTAFTLSIDTPEAMAAAANAAREMPLFKMKLAGDGADAARIAAVLAAAPARLILDANESLSPETLAPLIGALDPGRIAVIEQPLPEGADSALDGLNLPVPLCADESFHTAADIARLAGRYQAVNIKLDKTGGLTEALAAVKAARMAGLQVMAGCMVGSSLAMAPAFLIAQAADHTDLDGPLLLAEDDAEPIRYTGATMHAPAPGLWG